MGLRIGTNVAAINAQRNLAKTERSVEHSSRALSSGSRLVDGSDDAAGFVISEGLRGQVASLGQAQRNATDAAGFVQIAEGSLNEQGNILVRMRELAIQAASDTVGETERGYINTEFQSLVSEFDRIAQTTRYGGKQILVGSNDAYEFHVGSGSSPSDVIKFAMAADTRAASVGITGLETTTRGDANDSLTSIDKALSEVAKARASFGAAQSRFNIAANHTGELREHIESARSQIADVDVAHEVTKLASSRIQQEFALSILAQANQNSVRAMKLL